LKEIKGEKKVEREGKQEAATSSSLLVGNNGNESEGENEEREME
jgi:hypothetical protein